MSSAEALVVVGIIANISAVVAFTSKALSRMKDAGENTHETPKALRDAEMTLPLLTRALEKTNVQVAAGNRDEETCKVLRPVLEDCHAKMDELQAIFDKCIPKGGSSSFIRS